MPKLTACSGPRLLLLLWFWGAYHCPVACLARCPPGTVGSPCKDCPAGKFQATDADVCSSCDPGKYQPALASTQCLDCAPGTYQPDVGAAFCSPCEPGTYQPAPQSQGCLQCPTVTYQPFAQATACLPCPANQSTFFPSDFSQLADGAIACAFCPQGRALSSSGDGVCVPCRLGLEYCNGLGGALACSTPSPGQYSAQNCTLTRDAQFRDCTRCQAAKGAHYAFRPCTLTADAVCAPCTECVPMLQYQVSPCTETADTVCRTCNRSAGDMQVGGACNPCPAGAYLAANCALCPANTFSPSPNSEQCTPCPPNHTSAPGASQCVASTDASAAAARLLLIAFDPSLGPIQAAAPTLTPGEFMVVTSPSQLYVMGNGSSWLFAGAPQRQDTPSDGIGMQAVFGPRVLQLCLDSFSGGYLLLEAGSATMMGTLRWISQVAEVRTLEPRAQAIAFAGAPHRFLIATPALALLNVLDGTLTFPDDLPNYSPSPSLASLYVHTATVDNLRFNYYFLDEGLLLRFTHASSASGSIVCGGGRLRFDLTATAPMDCSLLALGASGAVHAVEHADAVFVLLFDSRGAALATIDPQRRLSTLLRFEEDDAPLQLLSSPDSLLLHVVLRNPPRILRVGLPGQCQCPAGLYCSNGTLCLAPPLGRIAPTPWTSSVTVPCPVGTISSVSRTACTPCPPNYTTPRNGEGAWFCRAMCEGDRFMNPQTGECLPECNTSLGLYQDPLLGQCLPCWLGSQSAPGGRECIPCPPGQYGVTPGLCAPCPPGTSTVVPGTTRCMPVEFSFCEDGGTTCPPGPNQPSQLVPILSVRPTGLVVWPNGSYVLSTSSRVPLAVYTVPTPTLVWLNADTGVLFFGDTPAWDPQTPIFHATVMQVQGFVPMVYVSTMLALEEGTPACAEVYAISTHDRSVTRFMSQDLLKSPTILLSQCFLQPLVLHVTPSGTLYAAAGHRLYAAQVVAAPGENLQGVGPQALFKQTPVLQVDQGVITHLASSSSRVGEHLFVGTSAGLIHSVPPTAARALGALTQVVSVINSSGATTEPVLHMGAAGRRVLFVVANPPGGLLLSEIVFDNVQACMGGYIATQLDSNAPVGRSAVCMQSGRGTYSGMACPPGTFGPTPAALHCEPCPPGSVAPREGTPMCSLCNAADAFSSADRTTCLAQCPAGSSSSTQQQQRTCVQCSPGYVLAKAGQEGTCVPCPAGTYRAQAASATAACMPCAPGFTSPPGAHSCVRRCASDKQCALDGETCLSLTKNYEVLSQINGVGQVLGLAVDLGGGVFFSDGMRIQYYQDTCSSYDTRCSTQPRGLDLLPPGQFTDFRFTSLAVCPRIQPAAADPACGGAFRMLYAGSLLRSSVYALRLCVGTDGMVNATATRALSSLTLLAGLTWPGFADGPFAKAAFNQPVDLELNAACDRLYVSDLGNNRIRLLHLPTQQVSTVVGSGQPCWKEGSAAACADPVAMGCSREEDQCASLQYPLGIGLSEAEDALYIAGNQVNSLFVFRFATRRLVRECSFSFSNMDYGKTQMCNLNKPESKGCMLHRPFDVAAFQGQLFVGVTQGITRIDEDTWLCEQVAGKYFDLRTAGLYDGVMPIPDLNLPTTSLVNMPFKIAVSKGIGVMYFADLLNGAVRRMLVKANCLCPSGTQLLPSANTCYNPSPLGVNQSSNQKPLLACPSGLYALPGDWMCFRRCADAAAQGLVSPPQCLVLPTSPLQSVTYAQLLSRLSPPQNTMLADWYGQALDPKANFALDGLFPLTATFRQGGVPGHAPFGGAFVTLTFDPQRQCWSDVEAFTSFALRPQLILPGLWLSCGEEAVLMAQAPGTSCACAVNLFGFERTPLTPEEEAAAALAPKRWQALRNAAVAGGAPGLTQSSAFMVLGTPDQTCGGSGPCFPVFQQLSSPGVVSNTFQAMWAQHGVRSVQCRVGWPAHYYCPNGYRWTPPELQRFSCSGQRVVAACLSCLPGTFSFASLQQRQVLGGPYRCVRCDAGFFASAVGSTQCLACPANTFASVAGSTRCTPCAAGKYTVMPAAYAPEQCLDCPRGTGNCTGCTPGEYQSEKGQRKCEIVPAGHYSVELNATAPTPCPEGTYQPRQGQTACIACELGFVTTGLGAIACTPCPASPTCPLSLGNRCASGCGLNRYYDYTSQKCSTCEEGKLNAQNPCASAPNVCWESPCKAFYLHPLTQTIAQCPPGTEASADKRGCVPCRAGSYADSASCGCAPCRTGTFSTVDGSTVCRLCPPGFSNQQQQPHQGLTLLLRACTACDRGTFAPVNGSDMCAPCSAGFIAPDFASVACQACPVDTVAPAPGMFECNVTCNTTEGFYSVLGDTACRYCADGLAANASCRTCGLGHYLQKSVTGTPRVCQRCPAGLVNLFNANATDISECVPCPSPTAYALLSAVHCVEADAGFMPNSSMTGQRPCAPGTFRNQSQTACTVCAPGFVSSLPGAEACAPCTVGFYTESAGRSECTQCASGSISAQHTGSTACRTCPAGTRAVSSQACLPCPNNTFSFSGAISCIQCSSPLYSAGGASACSACPDWTVWSPVGCVTCAPGTYMVSLPSYRCTVCRQGTFLPFGGSRTIQDCRRCPNGTVAPRNGASACLNCSTPGTTAQPDGISCARCSPGTYNADGGLCLPCPRGTFVTADGASTCQVCAPGTFQNASMGGTTCALCPPGTISDGSSGRDCISCGNWSNKFTSSAGQTACVPRLTACPRYYYINVTHDPTRDHSCALCVPCAPDQLTVAYDTSLYALTLLSPNSSSMYLNELCPGTTAAPLYRCLSMTPTAGQYLSLMQTVGAAVGNSPLDPYMMHPCEDPFFDNQTVAWVAGFDVQACYVSCLYGANLQAVAELYRTPRLGPPLYYEEPESNIFLQRMLRYKTTLCLPCPQSACPLGLYRPASATVAGCGPPCGILACGDNDRTSSGCILPCTNRPANAGYVGGGPSLGVDWCPWQCNPGWFLSDNRSACLPCAATAQVPSTLCNSSDYAVTEQCLPWHTSQDRCKYCAPMPFARLVGWNETCRYKCVAGYYANGSASGCTPCSDVWLNNWTLCPTGMYLDEAQCHITGERPTCKPCTGNVSFVSPGQRDDPTSCKASCAPGFHTVSLSTGAYADYTDLQSFPRVSDLRCIACSPQDRRSCNFTRACFPGHFRNVSVRDGQNNSCVPCTQSRQCPPGTYAPPCTGANLTDAQCLPCAPSLLANQRFVPYRLTHGRVIQPDHCPRVCLNNYVQDQLNPLACVPCASTPCPAVQEGVQPPLCAFVYAYWNATPAKAWWDAQHAPQNIPYSATRPVERAGVCWACPLGTATFDDSTALCVPLPGFSAVDIPLPNAKLPIPSLPNDIYVALQIPRLPTLQTRPRAASAPAAGERRLLQVSGAATNTNALLLAVPCPYGTYKTDAGNGRCNVCPEGASTTQKGSTALSACMCKYGHYLVAKTRGPCLPCPTDTFLNVSVSLLSSSKTPPAKCMPCPPNTSTLGVVGATSCACALGYVQLKRGACVLCPAGFYCPPCTDSDAQCIPSDMRPCFAGATSPPGSHAISNCTCTGDGLVVIASSRPKDSTQLYCRQLPPGAILVAGQLQCLPGWTKTAADTCALCPPGTYAAVAHPHQQPSLTVANTPICLPCPPNTYNPTSSAIGACTKCPAQHLSPQGSVRLSNCSCPRSLIPVPGGCSGCLPNQYASSVNGACLTCPPNSLAQAGASSIQDCLCMPGFEQSSNKHSNSSRSTNQNYTIACDPCKRGFYSTHASLTPCAACPRGSTTASTGSTRLAACGENPRLCLPGYTWRLGVGCFLTR
jgi:hypothetical protein